MATSAVAPCVGGSECSGLAATEVHVSELRLRLCIALLRRSRVQLRGLLLVLLYALSPLRAVNAADLHLHWQYVAHVRRALECEHERPTRL